MNKLALIIFVSLTVQTDWFNEIEKVILNTNLTAVMTNKTETIEKDGKTTIIEYNASEINMVNIQYTYGDLMDIKGEYYEKNDFVFGEILTGKDVLIYKRKRNEDEPYAVLIESKTYFKSESEGIKKSRRINIYENSNIEKLLEELQKLDFKTQKLDGADYIKTKEKYKGIKEQI